MRRKTRIEEEDEKTSSTATAKLLLSLETSSNTSLFRLRHPGIIVRFAGVILEQLLASLETSYCEFRLIHPQGIARFA